MAYEVINEKLKVEACRIGDLTMDQVESFLKLWGDGEKIETLTLFSRRDGTIVLNRDNKNYPYYRRRKGDAQSIGQSNRTEKTDRGT